MARKQNSGSGHTIAKAALVLVVLGERDRRHGTKSGDNGEGAETEHGSLLEATERSVVVRPARGRSRG